MVDDRLNDRFFGTAGKSKGGTSDGAGASDGGAGADAAPTSLRTTKPGWASKTKEKVCVCVWV